MQYHIEIKRTRWTIRDVSVWSGPLLACRPSILEVRSTQASSSDKFNGKPVVSDTEVTRLSRLRLRVGVGLTVTRRFHRAERLAAGGPAAEAASGRGVARPRPPVRRLNGALRWD
jgi:hypothetical protein